MKDLLQVCAIGAAMGVLFALIFISRKGWWL